MIHGLLARREKVGVIGLGYVGLPLLISFEKYFDCIGFDVSKKKIGNLSLGIDDTLEVGDEAISNSCSIFTDDPTRLKDCSFVIVAVPTPIDSFKTPDLGPVIGATRIIAANLKPGAVIVYESTVYPGVTEEVCKPILEAAGHIHGKDFFLGYSPERINPGDHEHRFETILKIVSGDSPSTLETVAQVYGTVVKAGVHRASSIKVAEAAKVIENVQRDVNIALMNELAILFDRIGIDTTEVLQAAGTKWNFIRMTPGLVGGHCIGVDPYYLTYKAEQLGYHPQIITSGRRINDSMAKFVVDQTIKQMVNAGIRIKDARVHVLGLTFKENCPDTRNSKVSDVIHEFQEFSCRVTAEDPYMAVEEASQEFKVQPLAENEKVDVVVLAVAHREFSDIPGRLLKLFRDGEGIFIDIKARFPIGSLGKQIRHWRL